MRVIARLVIITVMLASTTIIVITTIAIAIRAIIVIMFVRINRLCLQPVEHARSAGATASVSVLLPEARQKHSNS